MRGIYEVFYIFEYSPERYKNLIIRMFNSYAPIEYFFGCFKKGYLINEE
jgi:hypothetical protein